MILWVDNKDWRNTWEEMERIRPGGCQGWGHRVRSHNTGEIAFLKELKSQKAPERRARFFREAAAYESCGHRGLPRLIQSNAHQHRQHGYKPFIVTEFVRGPTLGEVIKKSGSISLEDAVAVTQSLLDVVGYVHRQGWVHRDIKPDNVILRNSNVVEPCLIDFGLGFKATSEEAFSTEQGQELGNRFLRLPELSVDSLTKRDVRSDLTFIGGILFFLLTGQIPATLMDSEGRMPHQRPGAFDHLRTEHKHQLLRLLNFFDKVFAYKFVDRHASAVEMSSMLSAMASSETRMGEEDSMAMIDEVALSLNTQANAQYMQLRPKYKAAMNVILGIQKDISKRVSPILQPSHQGYLDFSQGMKANIGFVHVAELQKGFRPLFEIKLVGDELVMYADGAVFHRAEVEEPCFDEEFKDKVRRIFASGLKELVTT